MVGESESKDFIQDNNALRKRYTNTQIKSRDCLSNIAYVGINKEDYFLLKFYFRCLLARDKEFRFILFEQKIGRQKQA